MRGCLERLVLDKTPLMVQQLARGERLALNAVDFSEVDATLMAQLLLQSLTLTCIDLGGSKPLPKEIKVLSDAFARCRFPLRELDRLRKHLHPARVLSPSFFFLSCHPPIISL